MYRYLWKSSKMTAGYIVIALISSVMGTGFAFLLSHMLDLVQSGTEKKIAAFLGFGCIYVIVMVLAEAAASTMKYKVLEAASVKLKNDAFCKIAEKTVAEFEKKNSAFFLTQLTGKSDLCTNLYFKNLMELPGLIGALVSAAAACIWFSPLMLLLMLGFSFLTVWLVRKPGKRVEESAAALSEELSVYTAKSKDYLEGFRLIKSFLAEENFCGEHNRANERLEERRFQNHKAMILAIYTGEMTGVFSTVVITGAAAVLAVRGVITAGAVLALAQLIGKIISPISGFVDMKVQLKSIKPVLNEFEELLWGNKQEKAGEAKKSEVKTKAENPKEENPKEGSLFEIQNVGFRYPESDVFLYTHVNLELQRGKKYLITGKSGIGKSTLFALLMGFYEPAEGKIFFEGRDMSGMSEGEIFKKVGYLQQNAVLFEDTLRNNICLFKTCGEEKLWQVISLAGLEPFVRGLPKGLDTKISEAGNNISGGEKQRICLARLLLADKEVFLLDEFETGIDEETKNAIENTVLEMKNKTILAISHDLSEGHRAKYDEVFQIEGGTIHQYIFCVQTGGQSCKNWDRRSIG